MNLVIHKGRTASWLGSVSQLLTLTLLLTAPAAAQQITGSLTGTVQDASGAVVPGANVALISNNTALRCARRPTSRAIITAGVFAGAYTFALKPRASPP